MVDLWGLGSDAKKREHSRYDKSVNREARKQLDEQHLATGIEIKEAYHQKRYGSSAIAESLVSDTEAKQELEVANPEPVETYNTSFRPGF